MDLNRIPPVLLQTFLTVAEAGQISEAARRLHLSQPAVTGHIRKLEASLETTLFIRSANGVSLTERGAHLRERVQAVFAELRPVDTCGSCRNQPTQLVAASDFSTYEQWICFYFRIFQASPHHLIFRLNVNEPNLVERLIPAVGTIFRTALNIGDKVQGHEI